MRSKQAIGNVDAAFDELGARGLYNMVQFSLQFVLMWMIPLQGYNIVFTGIHNPFRCNDEGLQMRYNSNYSTSITILNTSLDSTKIYYDSCTRPSTLFTGNDTYLLNSSAPESLTCSVYDLEYQNPKDRSFVSEFDLNCDREYLKGLSQTMNAAGFISGTLIFPYLTDRFGRKPILVISAFLCVGASLCIGFAVNYAMLAVSKLLIGFFTWGLEGAVTIILMESLATRDRSRFFACFGCIDWTIGVMLLSPIAYLLRNYSWRVFQYTITAIYAHIFLNIIFSDETLRWLAANGHKERAEAVIRRASRWNGKDPEKVLQAFYSEPEDEKELNNTETNGKIFTKTEDKDEENGSTALQQINMTSPAAQSLLNENTSSQPVMEHLTFWHMFTEPILLKHTLYVALSWFFNNLAYQGLILMSSTLAGSVYLNYALNALAEFPQAIYCFFFLKRLGRRVSISLFCVVAGLSLITVAILRTWAPDQHVLIVILSLLGKVGVTGSFNVLYTYTPEIFPTNLRNTGLGLAALGSGCGGMLAPFGELLFKVAVYAPGLVFGVSILGLSLLTPFMPETTHHPLPQTLAELKSWKITPLFAKEYNPDMEIEVEVGVETEVSKL